jgi:O-antigen/teichoic acid export membrane protein
MQNEEVNHGDASSGSESGSRWANARRRGGEFSWVLVGKVFLAGANGVLILVAGERLELSILGLFIAVIGAQLLASRILLLGTEIGVVRLGADPALRHQQKQLIQVGVVVTAIMTLAMAGGALLLPLVPHPSAARDWWVVASVVGGAAGTAWIDYAYFCRLGQHAYKPAAAIQSVSAGGRLLATGTALWLFPDRPAVVFLTYAGASFLAGGFLIVPLAGWGSRPDTALGQRLVRYSAWQGLTNALIVLGINQGLFLLQLIDIGEEAGIFGFALSIAMGFFILSNAFFEYLLPRATAVTSRTELSRFLRHSLAAAVGLVVICVPAAIVIGEVAPRFLSDHLHAFQGPFYLISAAMLLLVLEAPLAAAAHALSRPRLLSLELAVRVIAVGLIGVILVKDYGANGAAMAQLVGTGLALLLLVVGIALAWRDK